MSNHLVTAPVDSRPPLYVCESCRQGIAQGEVLFVDEGAETSFRVCHRCVPGNNNDAHTFYPYLPCCPRCGGEHTPFCD